MISQRRRPRQQPRRDRSRRAGAHRAPTRRSVGRLNRLTAATAGGWAIAAVATFGFSTALAPAGADEPTTVAPKSAPEVMPAGLAALAGEIAATAAAPSVIALAERDEVQLSQADAVPPVPQDSGAGRRVVFSESLQRVWLVDEGEQVQRSYLVSGSRFDNLDPGTFAVQSRLRTATAFDYTGTMEYFVQFTTGRRAPIGFHTIPIYNDGSPEQTYEQLGTALSAGCIRQAPDDAVALWDFAQIGTTVVVTA